MGKIAVAVWTTIWLFLPRLVRAAGLCFNDIPHSHSQKEKSSQAVHSEKRPSHHMTPTGQWEHLVISLSTSTLQALPQNRRKTFVRERHSLPCESTREGW